MSREAPNITWVTKSHVGGSHSIDDIGIRYYANRGRGERAGIIFREGLDKITKTEYIIFGIAGTRLYFKQAEQSRGYKYNKISGKNRIITTSSKEFTEWAKVHTGDYMLNYDSTCGMYYIETKED